jgi:hypothetical protein
LDALRRQLAERDREISRLQSLLSVGPEQPLPPIDAGSNARNPISTPLPSRSEESSVLQLGQFQIERQDGRLLFRDETGQPTFVFDEARRSIIAPRGVYIPAEGRLVMAEAPPQGAKSASAEQPVKVGFKNETRGRIDLAWVNYDGRLIHYKTLQPGEAHRQSTFETHPWVALNPSGKIVDLIHPSRQDEDAEFVFAPTSQDPNSLPKTGK